MDRQNRAAGTLLGLACGDALGRPVEFRTASEIEAEHGRLTEMVGHGTWDRPAGTVTDDTDQALAIARSLVEAGGWDPADVARRLVAWYESDPFDVGAMTSAALEAHRDGAAWDVAGQTVWERRPEGLNAGNGSVMRVAPLAVALGDDREHLLAASRESSQLTHADPRCTDGCAVLTATIAEVLAGADDPLESALAAVDPPEELRQALTDLPRAGRSLEPTGYVVDTLQVALHDALAADSAESAIVTAVNRGGDADTVGAVAGAVAGARFGADALPERWLAAIDETPEIRALAGDLLEVRR